MTSIKPDFFGWEMLYTCIERAIMRKTDVLMAFTHFVMLKHGQFLCLGLGDDPTYSPYEPGMEVLPVGWNYDSEIYTLRYVRGFETFLLTGHQSDHGLVIRLLNFLNNKAATITFDAEKTVCKIKGTIKDLIPDATEIAEYIRRELIDPVQPRTTNEVNTQTIPEHCSKIQDDEDNAVMQNFNSLNIDNTTQACTPCDNLPKATL